MAQQALRQLPFAIGYGTTANLFLHYNRLVSAHLFFAQTDDGPKWPWMQNEVNMILFDAKI